MLVFKKENSNKYYDCIVEPNGSQWIVTKKWGRIGSKGQSKTEVFNSQYSADLCRTNILLDKNYEGYKAVTDEEFKELTILAQIIGLKNKVIGYFWAKRVKNELFGNVWIKATHTELSDPEAYPGFVISYVNNKDNAQNTVVFTSDGTYELPYFDLNKIDNTNYLKIASGHRLYEVTKKLETTFLGVV